jgi:hypothetical protein
MRAPDSSLMKIVMYRDRAYFEIRMPYSALTTSRVYTCLRRRAVGDSASGPYKFGSTAMREVLQMKRGILLVDDDVAILLTLKAVLELSVKHTILPTAFLTAYPSQDGDWKCRSAVLG